MNQTFPVDQSSSINIPDLYQVHVSTCIDWEQSDTTDPQLHVPFSVKWMPRMEGFFQFIKQYRKITGTSLGGSRKSRYSYSDPTLGQVLSVGTNDDRSSLPHRISLSNFHLGPPITSYGCIYRYVPNNQQPHYLLIQRKDSVSYIDLIHGNYRESQLYFMLQDISEVERERVLTYDYDILWHDLHSTPAEGDSYQYGKEIFEKIKPHLKELFAEVPTADPLDRNLWLFPKGKINWKDLPDTENTKGPESPFECALREFTEETNGIDLMKTNATLRYTDPIVERYLGSNSKNYQTDYFVFNQEDEGELPTITPFSVEQTPIRELSVGEIQRIKWVTLDELDQYLRPERQQLVEYIENNIPEENVDTVSEIWKYPAEIPEPNLENNE
jgi:8-oxo-dGTP pyrophosphatase MutT (NUDIX family)